MTQFVRHREPVLTRLLPHNGNTRFLLPARPVAAQAVFATNPDSYTTPINTPMVVNAATGVLANDIGGVPVVTANLYQDVTGGSLALAADGSFTWTPPVGAGTWSFRYYAQDSTGRRTRHVPVTLTAQ